jgi:hypothetical protein
MLIARDNPVFYYNELGEKIKHCFGTATACAASTAVTEPQISHYLRIESYEFCIRFEGGSVFMTNDT